ncbi:helix-turn-helix domain-containing protein [Spirosoma spitsbergense]|uniref:helix-turn-helix domain-containing protein n=1 Tax=Spirosoma spitsbergense TaxID=431554 RepID=UPI0009FE0F9A
MNLTACGFQLLSFLPDSVGRTVTKTQILKKVWDSHTACNTSKEAVCVNFYGRKQTGVLTIN